MPEDVPVLGTQVYFGCPPVVPSESPPSPPDEEPGTSNTYVSLRGFVSPLLLIIL